MSYKLIAIPTFNKGLKRLLKKYISLKSEYANLLEELQNNPTLGTKISDNCYKIRLAITSKGKGKSGGARIVTYVLVDNEIIYLLSIYDKAEQPNITDKDLQLLIKNLN
jgi:mRNA-degrading endonuclease RelE of RelBE toxin-antitoxin system